MTDRVKALIVLGAGASYDVWSGATPEDPHRHWRPPLAKHLFRFWERAEFYQIAKRRRGGALELGISLASRLKTIDDFDIESALREFAYHDSPHVRRRYRDIPPYLRDIIWTCESKYVSQPDTYMEMAHILLSNRPHDLLFVSLNYDRLLERALAPRGYQFGKFSDYIGQPNVALLKLHGSTDWFASLGSEAPDWSRALDNFDPLLAAMSPRLIVNAGPSDTGYRHGDDYMYPVLTAPLAGKDPSHVVCPDSHLEHARVWLKDCEKILIAGCSGIDADLIQFLSEVEFGEIRAIDVVGKSKYLPAVRQRFKNVEAFRPWLNEGRDGLQNGFRAYVYGHGLATFASS